MHALAILFFAPLSVIAPLAGALDDAQAHAARLAEQAATAPAAPGDDEAGAFAALVAADQALARIGREQPAALPRGAGVALLAAINDAHAALSTYSLARADGDRETMRAAARDAADALARADALVEETRPYPLVHPR